MESNIGQKRIGIDVGGTFTDFVLLDMKKGTIEVGKTLTTPEDPAIGIMNGLRSLVSKANGSLQDIQNIVYGTTLVTNTVIERKGAKTGLITTIGYRDTLEIGNEIRYDLYDLFLGRPKPLVPRFLRREVRERIGSDGSVLVELEKGEVKAIAEDFAKEGVRVIAICLIHSYANPTHETAIKEVLKKGYPNFGVVLSSLVAPEIREYERTTTTVLNAYVQPIIEDHLKTLEEQFHEKRLKGPFYIMLSSGGITTVETAQEFPIQLIESGPAAGALAAAYYSNLLKQDHVISFDMGGTTAKICLIDSGQPSHSSSFETDRVHRFKKGSGLPVKVPVIDMIEIGAGGGSIAYIDNMGLLKVGPISAGSSPGPACYGFGGDRPTVTDADLLLGYLDPDYFLGGELKLDGKAAFRANEEHIAKPLKLDAIRAAIGIYEVINGNMASAAKVHISERGCDPRRYSLVAFGGAGPVHAYRVAQLLRIKKIICPLGAGVTSAFGLLSSPMAFDFVKTYVSRLEQLNWGKVEDIFQEMEKRGREMLLSAGIKAEGITVTRNAEMRYVGQGHEIPVPVPLNGLLEKGFEERLRNLFYESYRTHFGRHLTDALIEAINWRVVVSGPRPEIDVKRFKGGSQSGRQSILRDAVKTTRPAYFSEFGGFHETPVYDRYRLAPAMHFEGPAVIEERESTVVVGPNGTIDIDENYSIIIDVK